MRLKTGSLMIALLICVCAACADVPLTGCAEKGLAAYAEESLPTYAEERPIAVCADGTVFYADEVQRDLDVLLEDYALIGETLTENEREAAAQEILDGYVIRALTKARLKALGLAEPDENTLYDLREAAQRSYDAYWQSFRASEASSKLTDAELTAYLEENGINLDYFFETLRTSWETKLLMDHYAIQVEVTDEDIDAFYAENYVQPSRERYENNIPMFEEEVVYGDLGSAYTPEGFRILHQIVLPVPDDIRSELTRVENEARESAKKAEDAYNRVASLAMEGMDTSEQTEIYRAAMHRIDELSVEYGKLWQSVLTARQDECDELYARLQTGETFEDLMALFNPDDILIYHAKSERWSEELMAGASTLTEKGDISQPTLCADGVHILYYYDDVPSGAAKLEDADDREQLRETLIKQRTADALKELTDPWKEEFHLIADISMLKY